MSQNWHYSWVTNTHAGDMFEISDPDVSPNYKLIVGYAFEKDDAAVMSAAPAMFDALNAILQLVQQRRLPPSATYELIQACITEVIAKATGAPQA